MTTLCNCDSNTTAKLHSGHSECCLMCGRRGGKTASFFNISRLKQEAVDFKIKSRHHRKPALHYISLRSQKFKIKDHLNLLFPDDHQADDRKEETPLPSVVILLTFLESQKLIPKYEHLKDTVPPEVKVRPYQFAVHE